MARAVSPMELSAPPNQALMQDRPAQVLMQDSLRAAEAQTGAGASTQNDQSRMVGNLYGSCCLFCAPCGCAKNLFTVQQGYVGIVTEFGRYHHTLPPGRHTFNIMSEQIKPMNMRTVCADIPAQQVMTKDNLSVLADAVCFYNVFDAQKAAFGVDNYAYAISMLSQVTIRTVIGELLLSEILSSRHVINARLKTLIDEATDPWGIKVDRVELKEIKISEQMQRAMGAKAEAGQEAEAKIVQANAQKDAAVILKQAAMEMAGEPNAIKLQWFETLRIIATQGRNTTIIVPDNIEPATALAAKAIAASSSS